MNLRAPLLPRRTLLRGSAAAIALPFLDAMIGEGKAHARRGRPPLRFGTFYWGGGIVKQSWVPTATGAEWALPPTLAAAFPDLRPYLTLVTGVTHGKTSPGHIPARGLALSASHDLSRCQDRSCIGTYRGQEMPEPSVDALVAEAWRGRTVFDSVEIGICRKGPYRSNSSWQRGGRVFNRHEPSPQRLFDRLFSSHLPAEERARRLALAPALERSVLDGVLQEARLLQTRLGQRDRQRLDAHLEGVRGVERRLQERERLRARGDRACALAPPGRPSRVDFGDGTGHEEKEAKSRLMSDLLAIALACDRTRVFSYEWSATQSHAVYWETGARMDHHPMNHAVGDTEEYDLTIRFIMKNLAYLASALRAIPEGDGTLLDSTLILGTSEHGSSMRHDYVEHPYILVGRAGGRLRAGVHHRLERADGSSGARVLLTAVRAVGVPVAALGQDGPTGARRVRDGIGALEA